MAPSRWRRLLPSLATATCRRRRPTTGFTCGGGAPARGSPTNNPLLLAFASGYWPCHFASAAAARHGTARLFRFFLFSRAGGAAALADRSRRAPRLPSCGRFSGRRRRRRLRPSGRGRHATRSAGAGAPPFFLQPFSFPSLAARAGAGAGAPISATSAAPACPSAMRHKNSFQGIICCSEQGRHGVVAGESGSRDGRFVFRIHVWIRPGHKFFSHKCYPNVFSSFICTNSLKA